MIFGFALASILFDRFRLGGRIGIGEIILALAAYGSLLLIIKNYKKISLNDLGAKYVVALVIFLLFCITPNTLLNFWLGMHHMPSVADIFAYATCFFFLGSIAFLKLDHNIIAKICIFIVLIFTIAFIGSGDAWYGDVRFSGGSDNPNRLAIYLLSSMALLSQINLTPFKKLLCILALSILIYITLSDAARLGFIAMILTFIFLRGCRSLFVLPLFLVIGIIATTMILLNLEAIINFFINLWYAASTSNYRFNLILTGIEAWQENLFTILIGHGAGAFAGFAGPYEGWEAHSTPVDLLTVGGLFGFSLFYFPLIYSILRFIQSKDNFAASCLVGLIIFSLFAYVGRHPIIWFVIYVSLMNIRTKEQHN